MSGKKSKPTTEENTLESSDHFVSLDEELSNRPKVELEDNGEELEDPITPDPDYVEPGLETEEDIEEEFEEEEGDDPDFGISSDYDVTAEAIVGFIDGLQCFAMPFAYRKLHFSKQEESDLDLLQQKLRGGEIKGTKTIELTEYDQELLQRDHEAKVYEKSTPFKSPERTRYKKAWRKWLEKNQPKINFEKYELLAATVVIMLPRLIPIAPKVAGWIQQKVFGGKEVSMDPPSSKTVKKEAA